MVFAALVLRGEWGPCSCPAAVCAQGRCSLGGLGGPELGVTACRLRLLLTCACHVSWGTVYIKEPVTFLCAGVFHWVSPGFVPTLARAH